MSRPLVSVPTSYLQDVLDGLDALPVKKLIRLSDWNTRRDCGCANGAMFLRLAKKSATVDASDAMLVYSFRRTYHQRDAYATVATFNDRFNRETTLMMDDPDPDGWQDAEERFVYVRAGIVAELKARGEKAA